MPICVCAVDIHGLERAWFLPERVCPARRKRLAQTAHPGARAQSLGAELAFQGAAAMLPPGWARPGEYEYLPSGAPVLGNGLYMSLTHTPGLAACALSDAPVGVDAERARRVPEGLPRRVLREEQLAEWARSPDPDGCFLRLWTQLEARCKCPRPDAQVRTFALPGGFALSLAGDVESVTFEMRSYRSFRALSGAEKPEALAESGGESTSFL